MKKIPLTRGQFAIVDDEDFETLNRYKWSLWTNGSNSYASRRFWLEGKKVWQSMHRCILNPSRDQGVDHRDGNGLNNQKSNLRIATQSQNMGNSRLSKRNRSGYKGVTFCKGNYAFHPWVSRIRVKRKLISLGFFSTAKEAAIAYNQAALKFFGEFARLNKI